MSSSIVDIEQVRKFWDQRPCNIRHSNKEVGSENWSREVTRRKYFVEPHIPRFAQFSRWRNKNVLEIGCGIGTDSLQFISNGALLDAVDVSEKSLEIAKSRCLGKGKGVFIVTNAEEWLPPVRYDLVYTFGVLHHTPHPERIIEKVRERLRKSGEFRLMLYAKWSIKNLTRQQREAQKGCPLARTYTKKSVKKLLQGFEIVSIEKTHIFPWRIKDYLEHRYVASWYYSWMPSWLFRTLESLLGWHLLIVAKKI